MRTVFAQAGSQLVERDGPSARAGDPAGMPTWVSIGSVPLLVCGLVTPAVGQIVVAFLVAVSVLVPTVLGERPLWPVPWDLPTLRGLAPERAGSLPHKGVDARVARVVRWHGAVPMAGWAPSEGR